MKDSQLKKVLERRDIMKINPVQLNKLHRIYGEKDRSNNIQQKKSGEDEINISSKAKEIQELEQNIQDKSDIREERVNQIKSQIKKGTYEIESEKIAEKILEDSQE